MITSIRFDAHLCRLQAVADEVLARCERVTVPIGETPVGDRAGGCYACGGSPAVRVSMRDDGVEMFWANACTAHQDDPVRVILE